MKKKWIMMVLLSLILGGTYANEGSPPPPEGDNMGGLRGERGPRRKDSRMKLRRLMGMLEKEMPQLFQEVLSLREKKPEVFRSFVSELGKKAYHRKLSSLKAMKSKPEMKSLLKKILKNELDSYLLAQKVRSSESEEVKEKLKLQLSELLNQGFDLKEEHQKLNLKYLKERVSKLEEMIQKRRSLKDNIVQERLEEITGEREYLKW